MTGGLVRELRRELLISHKTNEAKRTTHIPLDWRNTLNELNGNPLSQLESERAWGKLCSDLRNLCPETNWISLCKGFENIQVKDIQNLSSWIKSLIATEGWPFPDKVLLIALGNTPAWKVIFPKGTVLPYLTPPLELTVTATRTEATVGWKISAQESYNLSIEGQA
jgi:hypothetical protein